jgi:hypothetical protein
MASMEHMQYLLFEDILESLVETGWDICFRDSDNASVEVIPKVINK